MVRMFVSILCVSILLLVLGSVCLAQGNAPFQLKPAVAVEAEDFTVEKGWKVVQNGQGNYMVDIIGFQHISGEKLLCIDEKDTTASAYKAITVPADGDYRLWVRYEYPPFTDTRFQVTVVQGGKTIADKLMGARDNLRLAFNDMTFKAQYDPSWGSEGFAEEVVDVKGLKAGAARIYLKAAAQPLTPGVAAHRNIDLVYLTSDMEDAWRPFCAKTASLYPILEAFRESMGARYEVRITNKGNKPVSYTAFHAYNRIPWGMNEGVIAKDVQPNASSEWAPLTKQDTSHFSLVRFTAQFPVAKGADGKPVQEFQPFTLEIRPIGKAVEKTYTAGYNVFGVYLPPYPGKGDLPITPQEEIDKVLALLKNSPKVGKAPTLPLCYGGWVPFDLHTESGKKYMELFTAIGMRNFGIVGGTPIADRFKEMGFAMTKSYSAFGYRNPPTQKNIDKWKADIEKNGQKPYLQWYDYGDEIHFSEWLGTMTADLATQPPYQGMKAPDILQKLWQEWLAKHRPGFKAEEYWLAAWGNVDPAQLRPDSSSIAAEQNARLYVDSIQFYEETAIAYVAQGMKNVKAAFGNDVLCGANYAAHPFYYPSIAMYVKWFRGGAADMGRHSEYFWQVTQAGPIVNGYIAEHFRCGLRNTPHGILRQYTMPHSPGNTQASFLRSAFTHLAHGAKMLDFFGIGMNEGFTENHIDHRDHQRYKDMRDITHAVGMVEDQLLQSQVLPSKVAILLSDSTERWDMAKIARDKAHTDQFGSDFRKTRLTYHQERLGIWTALTFAGAAPDLLVEDDLTAAVLKDYRVLYVVGDCLPPALAPVLQRWVNDGGVLMATAGAGQFDAYRQPNPALQQLLGIQSRTVEERATFLRPRQELPFQQPLSTLKIGELPMPQLATYERIEPAKDAVVIAGFEDGKPGVISRKVGKGQVFFCAALPGLAYVWSALQPPQVPDRGVNTHTVPTNFDKGAAAVLALPLTAAGVTPVVVTNGGLIDTRLIKAPGAYLLPLANYNADINKPVTVTVTIPENISKVTSAYSGALKSKKTANGVEITIPKLGYGDLLRLDIGR